MHPLLALEYIRENFKEFVQSKYPYSPESDEHKQLGEICKETGEVFQDPVLQLDRPRIVHELKRGEPAFFSKELQNCLARGFQSKQGPFMTPYTHQYKAWERLSARLPTVVSTGTGSGKSESFIIPLLDLVHRARDKETGQRRVRAIVIYPMNALLEDQHIRFCRFAQGLGLKVGIYNGSSRQMQREQEKTQDYKKKWKREIFGDEAVSESVLKNLTEVVDPSQSDSYPDVLLTNYSMLQYMLLRDYEHKILEGAQLEALALDEAHLYSGTLGLEMSALLARLRTHIESHGGDTSRMVPMATSATLVRGGDARDVQAMAEFFSGLFSSPFPKGTDWLIKDEYKKASEPQPDVWKRLQVDPSKLREVFQTACVDVAEATEQISGLFQKSERLADSLAEQLPWILLRTQDGSYSAVSKWSDAVKKYQSFQSNSCGRELDSQLADRELAGLLTWLSFPKDPSDPKSRPRLGLRVHSFTRSEPRIYREVIPEGLKTRGGKLLSESGVKGKESEGSASLPIAHCRNCGHEAFLALAEEELDGSVALKALDRPPEKEDIVYALHPPGSFEQETLTQGWSCSELVAEWDSHAQCFRANETTSRARSRKKKSGTNQGLGLSRFTDSDEVSGAQCDEGYRFWRVSRSSKDKENGDPSDLSHCPSCLRTKQGEQLLIKRGSPASDISVHAQNVLAAVEDDAERRLLVFCDNRQDSSFLAGFITDRHRRLRLRRAICQSLKGGKASSEIISENDANCRPFAASVLNQLKLLNNDRSPEGEFEFSTMRAALTADIFDINSHEAGDFDEWQQQLMDKVDPASSIESEDVHEAKEKPIPLDSREGRFLIRMLNEAILRDLSTGEERQGALRTLGLVSVWHNALEATEMPARNLACFLFRELLHAEAWDEKPKGLKGQRRQYSYNSKPLRLTSLAEALASKRSILGKAFRWNEPEHALRLALVEGDKHLDGEVSAVLEWLKGLLTQAGWSSLVKLTDSKNELSLEIQTKGFVFSSNAVIFRSSIKKEEWCVPSSVSLAGLSTGRNAEDLFEGPHTPVVAPAWRRVYLDERASESDTFVRAHEHNGMLNSNQATKAIQKFASAELNTLVATPTLEMGIDLPDLPVVVHRSVPPDPSNYAQRAGRAGRDKKRALLLTHCGRGAHDTGYFAEPDAMVSGQIAPPGCPRENTWLLKRHVNAIGLQVLAAHGLKLNNWDSLVDTREYWNIVEKNDISRRLKRPDELAAEQQNWRGIHQKNKQKIFAELESFKEKILCGLWADSEIFRVSRDPEELMGELRNCAHAFTSNFQNALEEYVQLLDLRKNKLHQITAAGHEAKYSGLRRRLVAELHSNLRNLYPIPFLQSVGFLPNFDFPMESVRFSGFRRNAIRSKGGSSKATVEYARGLTSAMKEFAPGQKHYAAGHVFQIDRYTVATQHKNRSLAEYGVCSKGCTELTKMTLQTRGCSVCGAPLVGSEGARGAGELPPILKLHSVQGKTFEYIGDRQADKDSVRLTSESLVIGDADATPSTWSSKSLSSLKVSLYESSLGDKYGLDVMTVVGSKSRERPDGSSRQMQPLYRSTDEADDFNVKAEKEQIQNTDNNDEDIEGKCIHPFLLGHKFNADALKIEVHPQQLGLFREGVHEPELAFFETLRAVLLKAIKRELFLSSRSNHLSSFVFKKVVGSQTERKIFASALYLYDSIPGGSGVFPLLKSYWNNILERAEKIILSTDNGFDCCQSKCKRCISTYENQAVDAFLDKRVLRETDSEGQPSRTTFLKYLRDLLHDGVAAADWKFEKARLIGVAGDEEDFEIAESEFRRFLDSELADLAYTFQEEILSDNSNLVTKPDFTFECRGQTTHVFVDGYKYHGSVSSFFGDLRKRNFIELREMAHVVSLPANRVVGKNADFKSLAEPLRKIVSGKWDEKCFTPKSRQGFEPEEHHDVPPNYKEYDIFWEEKWKVPEQGMRFQCLQVDGLLPSRNMVAIYVDPPLTEKGFVDKDWWHQFWDEVLVLKQRGYRPIFLVSKVKKEQAA